MTPQRSAIAYTDGVMPNDTALPLLGVEPRIGYNASDAPPIKDSWGVASLNRLLENSRTTAGFVVGGGIAATAFADWQIGLQLSLGALYLIPMVVGAAVYTRPTIIALATLCTLLRIGFGAPMTPVESFLNFFLVMMAYGGSGLFVRAVVESRRNLLAFASQLQHQQARTRQAEEQLKILAESSPAAIMTIGEDGSILAANRAALSLFGAEAESGLYRTKIDRLLPVLHDALSIADSGESFRTAAQCQGRRLDDTPFHAHIWFSTYSTPEGRHLAAIAVDSSDEVREREEASLRQLLTANRVLTAAVLHEIRNLCASISTAYSNLTASQASTDGPESKALGTMIGALGKLASANLQGASRENLSAIRLQSVLDQFRIVAEPAWEELDGRLEIRTADAMPPVVGDPQGLMQVLLNLMSNSLRVVTSCPERSLRLETEQRGGKVIVAVEDTGPGVQHPESLFVPFQSGADRVGLGLFLSRALMRSFGGELRHVVTAQGCRFELELAIAGQPGEAVLWLT